MQMTLSKTDQNLDVMHESKFWSNTVESTETEPKIILQLNMLCIKTNLILRRKN